MKVGLYFAVLAVVLVCRLESFVMHFPCCSKTQPIHFVPSQHWLVPAARCWGRVCFSREPDVGQELV